MIPIELSKHVQQPFENSEEWAQVAVVADRLHKHLNSEAALARIAEVNQPGRSSAAVQDTFLEFARQLGFESEKKGLFANSITGLRPDYYRRIGETGIILEVERGKTTTNNMDLLDFWKCHICDHASYLFLLVPKALQHNPNMTPKKEFESVRRRLKQFFELGNETNVRGLGLFGY